MSNETDWETWPPKHYPCVIVEEWKCRTCGTLHTSEFYSGELGDDDGDSFDFRCTCGDYYKKWCRVPLENMLRTGWRKAA